MSDLISREAVLDKMEYLFGGSDGLISPIDAKAIVRNAPAVDAEPVVRCKDCEWWAQNKELGTHYGVCYRFNAVTSKDSFCSYGRCKESELQHE